jgi:hypothetical protein
MSRREIKVFVALLGVFTVLAAGLMVGLSSLGAPDELTAVLVVAAFAFTALAGGFFWDGSPSDRH